ncbi:MAG TPA: DUF1302 family protein [Trueperaceae bacterium]|nr:DUF1302 family protein [Trueperaceae bacterium]
MTSSPNASSDADARSRVGARPPTLRRLAGAALLVAVALSLSPALAQVAFDLGGELSAAVGVDVGGSIPIAEACLELQGRGEVGSGFFPDAVFLVEGGACYDAAAQAGSHGGVPTDPLDLLYPTPDPFSVWLGEAYVSVYLGSSELSVGRQKVSWGSADALAPLDVVNPHDLSYPVAQPSETRLATLMARLRVEAPEGIGLDFVVVPVFEPSRLPGREWQPDIVLPTFPPEAGVVGIAPVLDDRPTAALANVQFGVRATFDLDLFDGTDASLTYFRGFDKLPTSSIRLEPVPGAPGSNYVQPVLGYDRIHVVGLDFSSVIGSFVVRGDAALTLTDDHEGLDPTTGNPRFEAVLGAERSLPGGAYLTGQVTYEHVWPDMGANATVNVASVLALRIEPDARLTVQGAWLHDYTDGSGLVQPSLNYALADGVTLSLEGTVFYGRAGSRYGAWSENSNLRMGVAYAF